MQYKIAKESQEKDFPDGIPECGADALRFGLLAYTVQGRDVNLDISRVVGYRQFCNKLWNAVRFAITYLTDFEPSVDMHLQINEANGCSKRDLFILSRLNSTIRDCNLHMASYSFAAVTSALHAFFLYDLCDVYLELIKPVIGFDSAGVDPKTKQSAQATLYTCLEQFLRLAHPIMPFVTEELWQRLPKRSQMTSTPSIMISRYPEPIEHWFNPIVEEDMKIVLDCVHAARSLRVDYRIPNHIKAQFCYRSGAEDIIRACRDQSDDFCTLAKSSSLDLREGELEKGWSIKVISDKLSIFVNLSGLVDIDAELLRLRKEVERISDQIESYRRKINAPGYESKVPENVRQLNSEKLSGFEQEILATNNAIASFEAMKS